MGKIQPPRKIHFNSIEDAISHVADRNAPRIKIVRMTPDVPLPKYQNPGDAGMDLHAWIEADPLGVRETASVEFGKTTKIRTGIKVAIPEGYEGQVRGRSGRAFYNGVFAYNGTIDSGFTGELMVLLTGTRQGEVFHVKHGDRIAQLVIAPVARCAIVEVDALDDTVRGEKGLGSTGA
jgi:dUTP pyrophosphatase